MTDKDVKAGAGLGGSIIGDAPRCDVPLLEGGTCQGRATYDVPDGNMGTMHACCPNHANFKRAERGLSIWFPGDELLKAKLTIERKATTPAPAPAAKAPAAA